MSIMRAAAPPFARGQRRWPHPATREWLGERLTALLLLPLTVWLALNLAALPACDAATLGIWMTRPMHYGPLLAFLALTLLHAHLGLRCILDDYVHGPLVKRLGLGAIRLLLLAVLLVSAAALYVRAGTG